MKHLFVFCAAVFLGAGAHAQTAKVNTSNNTVSVVVPDKLKINLSGEKLLLVYNNHEFPSADIQVLDSLIKKAPNLKNLSVEFDSIDPDASKFKAVDSLLKKCRCPVSKRSVQVHAVH